ncbi:hypothetical protein LAM69_23710, partial [Mycobacterium tuberculosis]|nr:hypothetical protein [Mycobacterium tuberculosis]
LTTCVMPPASQRQPKGNGVTIAIGWQRGLPTVNHLPDIKATGLIARVNTQAQRNLKLPRQLA